MSGAVKNPNIATAVEAVRNCTTITLVPGTLRTTPIGTVEYYVQELATHKVVLAFQPSGVIIETCDDDVRSYPSIKHFVDSHPNQNTVIVITDMRQLIDIKAGDLFSVRGYLHKAYADAVVDRDHVHINAGRKNGGMPSGYECADVLEKLHSSGVSERCNDAALELSKRSFELEYITVGNDYADDLIKLLFEASKRIAQLEHNEKRRQD